MKPEIVCFIQAFLFKRCAYITHNAIQLDLLHIFRCFMQVSDISFPLDATRDFFFFNSEQTTTSSFYCLKMDSQPSFTSLERIPQASSPTKPAMKDSDVGIPNAKGKASWERGETKTVPVTQPRLVVP